MPSLPACLAHPIPLWIIEIKEIRIRNLQRWLRTRRRRRRRRRNLRLGS